MNARIDQLVKSLLQKDSLEQCSLHELQQFADRHPYFGAAQLLLTKKLQTEKSDQYDGQLQKTYLFFHNPLWVEQLLNDTGTAEIKTAPVKEAPVSIAEEILAEPVPPIAPVVAEQGTEIPASPSLNEIVGQTAENRADTEAEIPTLLSHEEETLVEETKEPVMEEIVAASSAPVSETMKEAEEKAEQDEPPMNIPGLKIEPIDPAKAELVFEPYHTVDYFASQGINIKDEKKPTDKFGQQLKSFTDWLKTMKRLPITEIAKGAEAAPDQKVEALAEHSLEGGDVVTEAMAEVWEKQGNSAKAIDIYTKLSLLEPAKSPYFAAKIEDLKKLN
ncbi:MAG: hypothetical protein JNM19_08150 [Chitinophagaceae bacterium]|nr:hypothetical protein [Chitinophagaceae bacterium]